MQLDCKAKLLTLNQSIMKTNFSLLFYLKKPKNYVKGAV